MPRRKTLLIAVLVFVTQLVLASSAIYSAHALGPPSIRVYQNWDLDTARGFENVTMDVSHYTPTFVLARGTTGAINITFTTSESTPVSLRIWYGGLHPYTGYWTPNANLSMLPDGITYTIEPYRSGNVTVVPNANTTLRLQISAASDAEVRNYNLFLTVIAGGGLENYGYPTVLMIVEGNASSTTTTTTTSLAHQQKQNYISPDAVNVCVGNCYFLSPPLQYLSSVVLVNTTSLLRSIDITVDGTLVLHDTNSYGPYPVFVKYREVVIPPQVRLTPNSSVNVTFTATFANGETYSASKMATVQFHSNSSTTTINNTISSTTTTTTTTTSSTSNAWGGAVTMVTTSTITSTVTTQISSTVTSTSTKSLTETVADPSTYAWAVSATVATIVLAAILLLQRRIRHQ